MPAAGAGPLFEGRRGAGGPQRQAANQPPRLRRRERRRAADRGPARLARSLAARWSGAAGSGPVKLPANFLAAAVAFYDDSSKMAFVFTTKVVLVIDSGGLPNGEASQTAATVGRRDGDLANAVASGAVHAIRGPSRPRAADRLHDHADAAQSPGRQAGPDAHRRAAGRYAAAVEPQDVSAGISICCWNGSAAATSCRSWPIWCATGP